ncbi:MAG: DUF1768 domain-containing protein [Alphaproteobacteria bacterium]|nr:DUF1768 domain-containing protein [Alphaproteobacteria bacterium]
MDRSSYFIKDRAMFGSFPSQEAVDELEEEGVRFFINLTHDDEKKITPYVTRYTQISFPIIDRQVPKDWPAFARFIISLSNIIMSLKQGHLVYLHCKGGHGRSGVVVASLFCYMFEMSPENALEQTTKSHSKRSVMREKWRKLGSPQTYYQKSFVHKFFEPLVFYRAYRTGSTAGFSNFTNHRVEIKGLGSFPTSESAIQAYKNPTDKEYVEKQENSRSPIVAKALGRKTELRKDWVQVCDKLMYEVIEAKFNQNPELKNNLIHTGLRPIIQHSRGDYFWGDGGDGTGRNKLGKILTNLRESFYMNEE